MHQMLASRRHAESSPPEATLGAIFTLAREESMGGARRGDVVFSAGQAQPVVSKNPRI
jgi:hypothetical protein